MSVVIDISDYGAKKKAFKEKLVAKVLVGVRWVEEHKELVTMVTPIVVGSTAFVVKTAVKRTNMRKEESLKNLYCYDRSLGHYWKLKRELSNKEWLAIDNRKKNGERLADILEELKVLK